jgi:hypothetical protein
MRFRKLHRSIRQFSLRQNVPPQGPNSRIPRRQSLLLAMETGTIAMAATAISKLTGSEHSEKRTRTQRVLLFASL